MTFLFTDVEGSTRLWEEHPDLMHDAMPRHDEMLRDAIESHGGFVVKTTGDGFHAVFATAHDAVDRCGRRASRRWSRGEWNMTETAAGADGDSHG